MREENLSNIDPKLADIHTSVNKLVERVNDIEKRTDDLEKSLGFCHTSLEDVITNVIPDLENKCTTNDTNIVMNILEDQTHKRKWGGCDHGNTWQSGRK